MTDDEDVAAAQRAHRRRFPLMVVGALALLMGVGFCAAGPHMWPWTVGIVLAGVAAICFGEWHARR